MESIKDILKSVLQQGQNSSDLGEQGGPPSKPPSEQQTDPECQVCEGIGWLRRELPVGHPEFGRIQPCECTLAVLEATRRDRLIAWAGITEPEAQRTFDALRESPAWTAAQRRAWIAARNGAREFAEGRASHKWLVLTGPPGGGKSHMALAVLNHRIAHPESGQPGRYIVAPNYFDELQSQMGKVTADGVDAVGELRQRYVDSPLLILDDIGTEHVTGWALKEMFTLLNSRYRAEMETIICTNVKLDAIPTRLQRRLLDPKVSSVYLLDLPDWGSGRVW